jgi:DNA-binding IclR family transcriptional regulator
MSDKQKDLVSPSEGSVSSLQRAIQLLHALAEAGPSRVSDLARALGFTQATTHRLLQQLTDGGLVHQLAHDKRYALGLGLATLAARAAEHVGAEGGLRAICRPVLTRLGAALGETVFLMVRSGFDAVCLDRWEGPWPIRTFTGDIGGRVPLGVGQGAMCILAHLPHEEREEVLRYNVPRVVGMGVVDGVYLRAEISRTRELGYSSTNTGVLDGMAGVGVPIFDAAGRVAAAFSVGTLAARLSGERLPVVVGLLQKEAQALASQINPFDRSLRRPAEALRMAGSTPN